MRGVIFAAACAAAAWVPFRALRPEAAPSGFPGWPEPFAAMRPLPLTARELRLAEGFPGRTGRFRDQDREYVVRWIREPGRAVHPAEACYRGNGYTIRPARGFEGDSGRWSCFLARNAAGEAEVCQQVTDGEGHSWPEVSSWYWAAVVGRTRGPWWAVTVAPADGAGRLRTSPGRSGRAPGRPFPAVTRIRPPAP